MSQQPPPPGFQPPPGEYQPVPPAPGGPNYAEWWKRLVAALIDGVIVGIPSFILMTIIGIGMAGGDEIAIDPVTGELTGGSSFIATLVGTWVVLGAIGIAYYVYFHGNERGQTPGKMVMKIAVRDQQTGGSIGYGRAAVRWLVAAVLWMACYIPGLIDVLFPLWDDKKQTLHDKAVNSVVMDAA